MKKKLYIVLFLLINTIIILYSQETEEKASLFTFYLIPGIEYPIQTDFELMSLGANVNLNGTVGFRNISWLQAGGTLSYSLLPVKAETSLSLIGFGLGSLLNFEPLPRLQVGAYVYGGAYYGFFNTKIVDSEGTAYENQQGGGALFSGGARTTFFLLPSLSVGIDLSYINYIGLSHGLRASINVALHLDGFKEKVDIRSIKFQDIFPSQYKFYEDNSAGTLTFINEERFPIKDVSLSIFVNKLMDNPTISTGPSELNSGESWEIPINALFSNEILNLTEPTKVTARVAIKYNVGGREREKISYETMNLQSRNSIIWNDDRKAAAFVSPQSPYILSFSKDIAGMVREQGPKSINENIRMAMGIFESLSVYGLSYVIDPNTLPYEDAAQNTFSVDFLQYPTETLTYKGGDCDDLSILYCSLLESIGVESAFITVPGHIYSAFSLGIPPGEARKIFSNTEDLIYTEENTWVPVESTLISQGFLKAWQSGAEQWRNNYEENNAQLIVMSESWKTYEPSGSPGIRGEINPPETYLIENQFNKRLATFVDRELYPKINEIQQKIRNSRDPLRFRNQLGVLYARYGQLENAKEEFRKILREREYLPTLINLGNIHFLEKNYEEAQDMFLKAESINKDNPVILLNLAKINYELSNPALVNSYFVRATKLRPQLANDYTYLSALNAETEIRAEDIESSKNRMIWDEEEEEL